MSAIPHADPNTLSNHQHIVTTHTTLDVALDFKQRLLSGSVELRMKAVQPTSEVVLDTSHLSIDAVTVDGASAEWTLAPRQEPYGSALTIRLAGPRAPGDELTVRVVYSTTDKCTALQWMAREQTENGKAPYMFSQCQAIHARSLYPSQDTPAVKSPFAMTIRSPHPVVATGLARGVHSFAADSASLAYTFEQPIPIPSYLLALASGDIASASIGPRSRVWAAPEALLRCQRELEADMERFLGAAEALVYGYPWTTYDVLILPASFPYGGMENPNMTFATPTIISGDRSNIDVIAHELAHSWSGNLVTAANWEHFWLNEGWTTYLERRIIGARHGDQHFHFSAIIGWKALQESVALFGPDHPFTKLIVDLRGADPDDAFSSIPYEKGFTFLFHLDTLLGRARWDRFIPHYFRSFRGRSLDSTEFKQCLQDFFRDDADATEKLAGLDWDTWLHAPGLPPKPVLDTTLADVCYALAECWRGMRDAAFSPSPRDIDGWAPGQLVVFLEAVSDFEVPLTPEQVADMDRAYGFLRSENAEILSRFLTVGLKARAEIVYERTAQALGAWGRMKFVRPLMRLLNECDRELAVATFRKNESFYHPICREAVRKDLKL